MEQHDNHDQRHHILGLPCISFMFQSFSIFYTVSSCLSRPLEVRLPDSAVLLSLTSNSMGEKSPDVWCLPVFIMQIFPPWLISSYEQFNNQLAKFCKLNNRLWLARANWLQHTAGCGSASKKTRSTRLPSPAWCIADKGGLSDTPRSSPLSERELFVEFKVISNFFCPYTRHQLCLYSRAMEVHKPWFIFQGPSII